MTCGDKFNKNCPTGGSRLTPEEVDGRGALPRCRRPDCNCVVTGDACTAGHRQNPAEYAEQARTQIAAVRQKRADTLARPLGVRGLDKSWPQEAQTALEWAEAAGDPQLVAAAWAEKVRSMAPHGVVRVSAGGQLTRGVLPPVFIQNALRRTHRAIKEQMATGAPPEPTPTADEVPVTTVLNLATGKEQTFFCPPEEAVVAAFEQAGGNWNTWQYQKWIDHPERQLGSVSVACGDFTALRTSTARLVGAAQHLRVLQAAHDHWRQREEREPTTAQMVEERLMAALSDPVVVPLLREALAEGITTALQRSRAAWEVDQEEQDAERPQAEKDRSFHMQQRARELAEMHGGAEQLAQVTSWERQVEAAEGRCPDCHQDMNSFSGNEGIPALLYCPHCVDTAYDFDGSVLGHFE